MSLSGDKGVAQFKKSVKMGHPIVECIVVNNFKSKRKYYHALLTAGATKGQSFRESMIGSSTQLQLEKP